MRHEGGGKVRGRIREEAGEIADCGLPALRPVRRSQGEGGRLGEGGRISSFAKATEDGADLTAKNAARPAVNKGIEPRISQSGISAGRRNGRASRPRYP